MEWGEIAAAADPSRGEPLTESIAILACELGAKPDHVNEPTDTAFVDTQRRRDDSTRASQRLLIASCDRRSAIQNLREPLHLSNSKRAVEFRKAVIVAEQAMTGPAITLTPALIAQRPHGLGELPIAGDNHSSLAGSDWLVRIETKDTRISDAPHPAPAILCADRLAGILNDAQTVPAGQGQDRIEIRGASKSVHDKNGAGSRSDARFDLLRIDIQRRRIDVRKNRTRPFIQNHVARRDEGERRQDHFIALPDIEGTEHKMEAGCSRAHRDAFGRAHKARDRSFERGHLWPD